MDREVYEDVYVSDDGGSEDDGEVTYEDICEAVRNHSNVSHIVKLLDEYQLTKYEDMDALDKMTDDLWYNVMVPSMDNSYGFLDKTNLEVRHAFSRWLYENSNIGRRIAYILELEERLLTNSPSPQGVTSPWVGNDVVAGDEGQ
jgi:hypothetical protein